MRIGIDTRWIYPQLSGIGSYTQELVRHLALADKDNEYTLFFKHREVMDRVMRRPELAGAPNMQPRLLPYDVFT
ncbi:MAG: hypothetical protein EOM20_16555, partial [Spartobacteria bacterium]|nr:hypothetical protein [Spartobacteria bacterium]